MIDQAEHVIEDDPLFTFCKYEPIDWKTAQGIVAGIHGFTWTWSCHLIYYFQQLSFQLGAELVVH